MSDMPKLRRDSKETAAAIAEVHKMIAAGTPKMQALEKIGIARSVWNRHRKSNGVEHGQIDASSLPPRPTKRGKRAPKPINMNDVAAVAGRILGSTTS
jgi:hypothetical protein